MNLTLRQGEEAKPYPSNEKYWITNQGRVYSVKRRKFLTPAPTKAGYMRVNLGKNKNTYVHRMVAEAFIPNVDEITDEVNHIDEDKANNFVENLEWVSHKSNCNYGSRNKRIIKTKEERRGHSIIQPCGLYDVETGELLASYASIREASEDAGVVPATLSGWMYSGRINDDGTYYLPVIKPRTDTGDDDWPKVP